MNVKSVSPLSLSSVTPREESRQGRNAKDDPNTLSKKEAGEEKGEGQPFFEQEEMGVPLLETVKWLSLIKYRPKKRRANAVFKKAISKNKGFDKKI